MPVGPQIKNIRFAAGRSPSIGPLDVAPSRATILVGPNNSGKSLALREIFGICRSTQESKRVVASVECEGPDTAAEVVDLAKTFWTPRPGVDAIFLSSPDTSAPPTPRHGPNISFGTADWDVVERQNLPDLKKFLLSAVTVLLDCEHRLALSSAQEAGALGDAPQNILAALFRDDRAREAVRQEVEAAFPRLHFLIDPTRLGKLSIRLSESRLPSPEIERCLSAEAIDFQSKARPIDDFGDGIRAYTGLTAAARSLQHRIILIDEPELFLHPPLARRLGGALVKLARDRAGSLVLASHSSDLLLGCLESNESSSTVVRLTYSGGEATARALSPTELLEMATDPLLRSSEVLAGVFHHGVVVTEADADRVFYGEMNRRLTEDRRGVEDVLFVNGQNAQTAYRLAGPLRRIGVPAAVILDLDVISMADGVWDNLLIACQVPHEAWGTLQKHRREIVRAFERARTASCEARLNDAIKRGVRALGAAESTLAVAFLKQLGRFGIFLVPEGEVECWLRLLGLSPHGKNWVPDLFSRIGRVKGDADYLGPGRDGVWEFLDEVAAWVNDPRRAGMG